MHHTIHTIPSVLSDPAAPESDAAQAGALLLWSGGPDPGPAWESGGVEDEVVCAEAAQRSVVKPSKFQGLH